MVMLDAPSAGPQPTARSPARDRRLRQLRQNARVRLRLVADVAMLAAHHSSHPPVLVDAPVARAGPGWRHEAAALRGQITDLRALVVSLMAAHHHGPAGPAAPAVVAREHDAGVGLDARVALAPASDAATEDGVTAGQASVPVVAVGAKADEDVVMDPVVVAAEKTATEAAVDAVTTAAGAVLSAKLAAGMSDSVAQAAMNAWFACFASGRVSAAEGQDPVVAKSAVEFAMESVKVAEGTKPDAVEKLLATVETMNAAVENGVVGAMLGEDVSASNVDAACEAALDAWFARFPTGLRLLPRSRRRPAVLLRPGHEPPTSFQGLC